jgi:WD40 repeat protein
MAGGADGLIKYWDLTEGGTPTAGYFTVDGRGIAHEYAGHSAAVTALHSDEVKVVSAARDGSVRVYDMKQGSELFRIEVKAPSFGRVTSGKSLLAIRFVLARLHVYCAVLL